ncbi:MAG: hypothetical protein QGI83_02355 [Candidatus Latescibacteria bacterium]|jgi:hypothetical protein|nr:hypothetical protein [Candidatus Latescibacterota bacterium]
MTPENRVLVYLGLLAFVDIFTPIPIVAAILVYVVFQKPPWFRDLVGQVYGETL